MGCAKRGNVIALRQVKTDDIWYLRSTKVQNIHFIALDSRVLVNTVPKLDEEFHRLVVQNLDLVRYQKIPPFTLEHVKASDCHIF